MNFENALKKILEWEGGYTNDPDDSGGETNYGITKSVALRWGYLDNMKNIPMDLVKKIYRTDYWDRINCDKLPENIKLFAFDTGINMGVGKWEKYLSEGLGAENNWNLDKLRERREKSYTEIAANKNNSKFLKGWINRLNDIYSECKKESKPCEIENTIQIAEAEARKNIREDNGDNRDLRREIEKYWLGSLYPNGFTEGAPYCCAFVTWVCSRAGFPIPRFVSCDQLAKWSKNGGNEKIQVKFLSREDSPEAGDIVLFDTAREGMFNHVGIVVNVQENTLTTIEGNTVSKGENLDNNPVGGVYKKTIKRFGNISGFIRILNSKLQENQLSNPEDNFVGILKQKKSREQICGVQLLANLLLGESLIIDGDFGTKTENALRKLFRVVKEHNEEKK